MSPIDDELRRVLASHADDAALQTDPLAGIEREAKSIRRRRTGTAVLGAALSVAVVALAVPSIRTSLNADGRKDRVAGTPSPTTPGVPPLNKWGYRQSSSILFDNSIETTAATAWIKLHHADNRQVESTVLYADRWSESTIRAVWIHDGKCSCTDDKGNVISEGDRLVWVLASPQQADRVVFEQPVEVTRPAPVYSLELPGHQTAVLPAPGADVTVNLGERQELLGDRPTILTHDSYDTVRIRAAGSEPVRVDGAAEGIPVTAWGPRGTRSVVEALKEDAIAALAHDHPEVTTPVVVWGGRTDAGTHVAVVAAEIRGHGRSPRDSAWVAGAWVVPKGLPGRLVAVHDLTLGAVTVSARVLTSADATSDPWIVVLAAPGAASTYHPDDNHFSDQEPEEKFLETRWQPEEPGKFQLILTRLTRGSQSAAVVENIGRGASYPDI